MLGGENMKDKIEYTVAAALAAVIVSSPITVAFYFANYVFKIMEVIS